jgi:tripartite-type tricarboxylate transporter receptor subunit TctC
MVDDDHRRNERRRTIMVRYGHCIGAAAMAAALLMAGLTTAQAQAYPTRTVRLVVPFAPGGSTDIVARLLAPQLSMNLGQSVVVDNRGGGGATIGMDIVAKSPPDGHTLGIATLTFALNPSLFAKMPYDSERDFVPVSLVSVMPFVMMIHPSVPARTVKELVALAKSKPGALNFSSSGIGSASGTDMTHIGYTGGGPALTALLSGQVSIFTGSILAGLSHFKSGRLIPLGVTGTHRNSAIPDVPTIAESGLPGYDLQEYQGIMVPAGTPPAVVKRLNSDIVKALSVPELKERFTTQGAQVIGSTPEQLTAHIKTQTGLWGKVIKSAGIKLH